MAEGQSAFTVGRILRILRHAWLGIFMTTAIGGVGAYLVSDGTPPTFQASSSVYFSLRQGGSSSDLNQGSAYTQAQMLSFARLATASITLDRVVDDLDLGISSRDLARNIEISIPQNTVTLDIEVTSRSADRAALISNSVASNLSDVVVDLAPTTDTGDATVAARVIEPAVPPAVQSAPNTPREAIVGAALGFLVGALGSILLALLETRVRSAEVVAAVTTAPLLGQIGRFPRTRDTRPVMIRNPNGEEAEAFRRVRAGLRFASVDRDVRSILITSSVPAEGKTTLAINIALAVAETGARVLLIDADLRRPRVADALEVEGVVGLTTVLVDEVSAYDALSRYGSTNLDLLLAGDVPPNPSELLSSSKMALVLQELSRGYDTLIIDSAPVLSVADAALLASHVDLTLLVVDSSKTRRAQLARTITALEVAGTTISGIVLNRLAVRARKDAYYYDLQSSEERSTMGDLFRRARDRSSGGSRSPLSNSAVMSGSDVGTGRDVVRPDDVELADNEELTDDFSDPSGTEREFADRDVEDIASADPQFAEPNIDHSDDLDTVVYPSDKASVEPERAPRRSPRRPRPIPVKNGLSLESLQERDRSVE